MGYSGNLDTIGGVTDVGEGRNKIILRSLVWASKEVVPFMIEISKKEIERGVKDDLEFTLNSMCSVIASENVQRCSCKIK